MSDLSPREVLRQLAAAAPASCLEHIVVIGSLAAGYQLIRGSGSVQVRTKDVDCVLAPRVAAVERGKEVAESLLASGWTARTEGPNAAPGDESTPQDRLPLIRLHPPTSREWFIEFLTVSDVGSDHEPWSRVRLSTGHYALRSFEYSPLLTFEPDRTEFGVYCARPEMMALANLLEHPRIGSERMSGLIAGRAIKRSNKDLGRVIAIAWLAGDDRVDRWADEWETALRSCFADRWQQLALRVGNGLRELLASDEDFTEAAFTCRNGLLANQNVRNEQLKIAGERVLLDAIEAVEARGK